MNWNETSHLASGIVDQWNEQGGPGGGIFVFDLKSTKIECYGGYADLSARVEFGEDTSIRLASITKHFTAAASLIASENGSIDLSADISKYLPEAHNAVGCVPLVRALDMSGGLPDPIDMAWHLGIPRTAQLDAKKVFEFLISNQNINFQSGAEVAYSNSGYRIAEAILDRSDYPLFSTLNESLFSPLDLQFQMAPNYTKAVPGLASGYWMGPNGWQLGISGMPYSGADSLISTGKTLVRWLQNLICPNRETDKLLQKLSKQRPLCNGALNTFGLGLIPLTIDKHKCLCFGGQLPGYNSHFVIVPEGKLGALVISNREDTDSFDLATKLLTTLLEVQPPSHRAPTVADGIYATNTGPHWLSISNGSVNFMGAQSNCYVDHTDSNINSSNLYLPLKFSVCSGDISGEFGFVKRKLFRVPEEVSIETKWAGSWGPEGNRPVLTIDVSSGEARVVSGVGPSKTISNLLPIGNGRALFERSEGPRKQMVCLEFDCNGAELKMSTFRSRNFSLFRI